VLEVDGTMLCQSNAFSRYLARQFGMAGKTPMDEAKADMIVDCAEDFLKPIIEYFHQKDETKKAEMKKKYEEEQLPTALANLEKMLKNNNGGDGYFVGDSLTWADLSFFQGITWPEFAGVKIEWSSYPKLQALRERVGKLPQIAEWVEKRPKTEM
jgi:glutathione S-transferase